MPGTKHQKDSLLQILKHTCKIEKANFDVSLVQVDGGIN